MKRLVVATAGLLALAVSLDAGELRKQSRRPIRGQYIVVLKDSAARDALEPLAAGPSVLDVAGAHSTAYGIQWLHVYEHALKGYAARMNEAQARDLANDPGVAFVEEDGEMRASVTQTNATWGLDRIDQRDLPLSTTYTYNFNGTGVNAYIVDTGIRSSHQEFGGRVMAGFTSINDGNGTEDCNGHGTHVAGTVGGTTYGVAKNVALLPVRVLDCNGSGSTSGVIAGVDWVTANHVKPAVANMSLGGGASGALDTAVVNSINAGVTYAVAAGNENADACNGSPSRVAAALTIGSSTSADARSSFSNWGTCVDVFAPGSSITSSWNTSDTATNTISGTSMATPHVVGVVALYLDENGHTAPATVASAIVNNASLNKLTGIGTGSPNRLLHSLFGGGGGDTTPPTTSITAPSNGSTVSGTITVTASASDNVGVSRVEFYIDSVLRGTDATAPYEHPWDTTTYSNGSHSLFSRAFDGAGNSGTSTTVSVTVSNATGGSAVYDSVLKAPQCGTVGSTCDSGTLLNGRGSLGPEPNQPNTINNSCADGASGTYHSDESNDRIRVVSVDGTNFAPGKSVRIEATVWAWSTPSSDHLDLYYAADANSPSWTFVTTLTPTVAGAQALSATYTLPSGGSLQAVRARFRYLGSASSCSTGAYDDHDDLVFAVGGGGGGGTELVVNGGFEGSASPWVLAANAFHTTTGAYPHTGSGYVYMGAANSVSGTAYQTITIPSTASGTGSFWLNVTSSETTTTIQYDKLFVEVRSTSGTLLATLATYSNLNKGTAGVYSQKSLNLSAYKGQTIRLQFRATTDSFLVTTFRIDDVSLK